jgi:hypothetical protein
VSRRDIVAIGSSEKAERLRKGRRRPRVAGGKPGMEKLRRENGEVYLVANLFV